MPDRVRKVIAAACLMAAGCAAPLAGANHIAVGDEPLRLELVRYAGRMTVSAWVDSEENLIFRSRLDRVTFELPVRFDKARVHYDGLVAREGSAERAAPAFAARRNLIDRAYEFDVTEAFAKFWKTGPFTTPESIDRVFLLDDRLRTPGLHRVQIVVEPDTVSWSVTFRLVRGRDVLYSLDLDSGMYLSGAGRPILPPAILIRVPDPAGS